MNNQPRFDFTSTVQVGRLNWADEMAPHFESTDDGIRSVDQKTVNEAEVETTSISPKQVINFHYRKFSLKVAEVNPNSNKSELNKMSNGSTEHNNHIVRINFEFIMEDSENVNYVIEQLKAIDLTKVVTNEPCEKISKRGLTIGDVPYGRPDGHFILEIDFKKVDFDEAKYLLEVGLDQSMIQVTGITRMKKSIMVGLNDKRSLLALEKCLIQGIERRNNNELCFQVSVDALTQFAVKTEQISDLTLKQLPFIKDGRVDQESAEKFLAHANPDLFYSRDEIEVVHVVAVKDRSGKRKNILEVKVKQIVTDRLVACKRKIGIDLLFTHLSIRAIKSSNQCFGCMQFGHKFHQCPRGDSR